MNMDKILSLISQGESQTAEFKTSFQKQVIESVVAFANAKGGKIFIGIKDNGTIQGIDIGQSCIQLFDLILFVHDRFPIGVIAIAIFQRKGVGKAQQVFIFDGELVFPKVFF